MFQVKFSIPTKLDATTQICLDIALHFNQTYL